MGVHGLLTIWCAPCSAWPLLRIWYGNSREFCPKPHRRAAAAARSTPSRKPRPAWRAVLCAAWAASSPQGRALAGQGRSPCGLGGYKGCLFYTSVVRQEQDGRVGREGAEARGNFGAVAAAVHRAGAEAEFFCAERVKHALDEENGLVTGEERALKDVYKRQVLLSAHQAVHL